MSKISRSLYNTKDKFSNWVGNIHFRIKIYYLLYSIFLGPIKNLETNTFFLFDGFKLLVVPYKTVSD